VIDEVEERGTCVMALHSTILDEQWALAVAQALRVGGVGEWEVDGTRCDAFGPPEYLEQWCTAW
jgi:hypothetical protein